MPSSFKLKNGTLYKDEVMTICPISPGLVVPGRSNLGQPTFNIQRFGCMQNCPHFSKEGKDVTLKCQADTKFTLDDEIHTTNPASKLKLN